MPEMDGFELCRQVKRREDLAHIPFIFYTATYTEDKDEELGLKLGASRFITKPLEPERFQAIIHEVVKTFDTDRLIRTHPPSESEEVLLHSYNQRLVRKVEQKVAQLKELNQQLKTALSEKDHEMAERLRAEDELRELNSSLEERVARRTAELAEANHELESFASAVSHDLAAPLRRIEGWGQLAASRGVAKLDPQAGLYLERIQDEADKMRSLIQALLTLSRATRCEMRPEQIDLSQLANEIKASLEKENPERVVDFIVAPGVVAQGDPILLRAALQNLLENAWKFTAKRPRARIEFGAMPRDTQPAFFIRDNGAGFAPESAASLFAPFSRLHNAEDFAGTGIGLATVQRIIRRHGGRVWAEGQENNGATFYFTLPK
jgi:signal transduction histidine kinase